MKKNARFEKLHPGMTRTAWAKEKREKKLNKNKNG